MGDRSWRVALQTWLKDGTGGVKGCWDWKLWWRTSLYFLLCKACLPVCHPFLLTQRSQCSTSVWPVDQSQLQLKCYRQALRQCFTNFIWHISTFIYLMWTLQSCSDMLQVWKIKSLSGGFSFLMPPEVYENLAKLYSLQHMCYLQLGILPF